MALAGTSEGQAVRGAGRPTGSVTLSAFLSVGLVVIGLAFALGLDVAWGLARMRSANPAERIEDAHVPHPRLGWVPRPGEARHSLADNFDVRYGIDDAGLRRVPGAAASATTLWLFGDSFTFGHGVSDAESWPSVLARDWLGGRMGVRNAAVMGYGLAQQVQRLRELAPRLREGDRVVFAPLSTDFERSLRHFAHPSRYLFRDDKGRIEGYPGLVGGRLQVLPFDTPWNRARALVYNARLTGSALRRIHHVVDPPRAAREGAALLEIARTTAEAQGAAFAWLLLPHPRECERGTTRVDLRGLAPTDLCPWFPRDAGGLRAIRFDDDSHWNSRGHVVAARAVAASLLQGGLLDESELRSAPGRPNHVR